MPDDKKLPANAITGEEYVRQHVAKQMGEQAPPVNPGTENQNSKDNSKWNNPTDENSADMATKKPVLQVLGGKMILLGVGCFFLVLLVGGAIAFYIFINNVNKAPKKPTDIITTSTEPEIVDAPAEKAGLFGYIKDKRSIWTIDINGKNRDELLEISSFKQKDTYTDLSWKNERELSYSICPLTSGKGCKVFTYNLDDKSQNQELNIPDALSIPSMSWNMDQKYMGLIVEDKNNYSFYFKSGTVLTKLNTFLKNSDPTRTKARTFFSDNGEYVIFYAYKTVPPDKKSGKKAVAKIVPTIEIYRINGVKVDSMDNASDPFVIDSKKIGFKRDNVLYFKEIGNKDETKITTESGINPVISPNKTLIAYWNNESSDQKKVILQVFDTNLNIRRDILRGIILPIWLNDNRIAGIKSDNCLGDECLMFEFQTAGLVVVDIKTAQIFIIDQGAMISNVVLNPFTKKVNVSEAKPDTRERRPEVEPNTQPAETQPAIVEDETVNSNDTAIEGD